MEFLFDTETTGIPRAKANPDDPPNAKKRRGFPRAEDLEAYDSARLVSIAWVVLDAAQNVIQQEYYVVRPDGFEIPESSTRIHGISQEHAMTYGMPLGVVLNRAHAALARAYNLIAYNVGFDVNVLRSEAIRANHSPLVSAIDSKKQTCAMLMSQTHMAAPFWPKLADAYRYVFQRPIEDAHNAMGDVISTYKLYKAIQRPSV